MTGVGGPCHPFAAISGLGSTRENRGSLKVTLLGNPGRMGNIELSVPEVM
jgi:hypothetical protein